jgi:HSP20 family molecular chaperone IbpA
MVFLRAAPYPLPIINDENPKVNTMVETRQKPDKSEASVRVEPMRTDPSRAPGGDVATQLVEKANDLQQLEHRINALQNDISQLASLATSAPGTGLAESPLLRLAPPPYFAGLNRFGPVAPGLVPPAPLAGFRTPLFGTGAPAYPLGASSEAFTTRDFNAMPYVTKQPGVNIVDSGEEYVVQVELPATKKKDLELLGSDRSITIMAQVRPDPEAIEGTVIVGEVTPTMYRRTITLPSPCNTAKSKASLKDGVLTLNVPKKDPSNGLRRIDVAYG